MKNDMMDIEDMEYLKLACLSMGAVVMGNMAFLVLHDIDPREWKEVHGIIQQLNAQKRGWA